MDFLTQDLRFALRSLARRPGMTTIILATVALGIGANTAIFSVLEAVTLRPLPFEDSERALLLWETHTDVGSYTVASPPNVLDWQARSKTVETFGIARGWSFVLTQDSDSRTVQGCVATDGWFDVHGVQAHVGRLFSPDDLTEGRNRVAVLSEVFWRESFAGDPDVLNSHVVLGGSAYEIIGVLPKDAWMFRFGDSDIWLPLTAIDDIDDRSWRGFFSIGRLAKGANLDQARAEMQSIRDGLADEYPATNHDWGVGLEHMRTVVASPVQTTLWILLGSVGFVLLIACANVANLLLIRATDRRHEFAVRASVGADSGHLLRQNLTESLLLATAGGAIGLVAATWVNKALVTLAPPSIPRLDEVGLNQTVLIFTLLVAIGTGILFGLAPALKTARFSLAGVLRDQHHGNVRTTRTRKVLVIGELALSLVLLIGAGLMVRAFSSLLSWEPGFDKDNLVTVWALAPDERFETPDAVNDAFELAANEIVDLPVVSSVGMTSAGPLFGGGDATEMEIPDQPELGRRTTRYYDVDPNYFATMGFQMVRGRGITTEDRADTPFVAVVNQALARRYWPEKDPIGKLIVMDNRSIQIVGVVQDVKPFRPDQPVEPAVFWSKRQGPRYATFYVIRTNLALESLNLSELERQVKARVQHAAPDLQLSALRSLESRERQQLVAPRFPMLLVNTLACVAILLAAIGIYGVVAHSVSSRKREIAIRMAIGAQPARIAVEYVRSAGSLVLAGIVLGISGALLLSRLLAGLLYGLSPYDPSTYLAVCLQFVVVGFVASLIPARRAAKLDPATTLRQE
jgi:putative ABC transport system permease protein